MMTRRIIFLDIDGVLNTAISRKGNEPERGFDRAAVQRLNRIVAKTGAEVVLSSAWRAFIDAKNMQAILESVGFVGRVVDRTPRRIEYDPQVYRRLAGTEPSAEQNWPRGYEIQQWLDGRDDIEGLVILDDRDDMNHLSPWLVRTSFQEGLLDVHVIAATRMLDRPAPSLALLEPGPPRMVVEPILGTPGISGTPAASSVRPLPAGPGTVAQRVVFLDIDGVLNNARSRASSEARWRDVDPEAVGRLDEVLERAEAVVVLSSAWRRAVEIAEVQARLQDCGFRGQVIDRTPVHDEYDPAVFERLSGSRPPKTRIGWPRGYEIQQWLDGHAEVTGVVILDERKDMEPLVPWLVATSYVGGLQKVHVDRAVARLLSDPPPVSDGKG